MNNTEIFTLDAMLTEAKITHTFMRHPLGAGFQIRLANGASIIQTPHSYGGMGGYLETMGVPFKDPNNEDDVEGWLTAEEVFALITDKKDDD